MKFEPHEEIPPWRQTGGRKRTFLATVVYDGPLAASRAMELFAGLVRKFGDDFDFQCHLLRFDVLELPEAIEDAIRAGEAADLIIVSARCEEDLPAAVKDWLQKCLASKAPGSAALVGLLEWDTRAEEVRSRTRQLLQSAADRKLLDFFLHEVDLPQTDLWLVAGELESTCKTGFPEFERTLRQGQLRGKGPKARRGAAQAGLRGRRVRSPVARDPFRGRAL